MGDLSLVHALGLELPSKSLRERFGDRFLEPALPVIHRRQFANAAQAAALAGNQAANNAARNPLPERNAVEDRGWGCRATFTLDIPEACKYRLI